MQKFLMLPEEERKAKLQRVLLICLRTEASRKFWKYQFLMVKICIALSHVKKSPVIPPRLGVFTLSCVSHTGQSLRCHHSYQIYCFFILVFSWVVTPKHRAVTQRRP